MSWQNEIDEINMRVALAHKMGGEKGVADERIVTSSSPVPG